MSKRNRRWVPPGAIETPERGAALDTPEGADLEHRDEAPEAEPLPPALDMVDGGTLPPPVFISERDRRLAAARALQPDAAHWVTVWLAGRDAAVSALEGGAPIATVYALTPPEGAGCRDCWSRGRDAALRVIQGV